MIGFILNLIFKPKPELPPIPTETQQMKLNRSVALETKSMNERKRRPTHLQGHWLHKLCGLKRNIVLVNKTDYHIKFIIKKIPSCKCFMSTFKIVAPGGAGIEGNFESRENQETQVILLGPMTDEYIDHVVYPLPSKNVLVTLEIEGKMMFTNRKMGAYDKYTCRNHVFFRAA